MNLIQSPVIFNEDEHSYYLGEKRLLGITGLIHSVLGLGVYPEANEYTKDRIIPRAGSRGTAVHHAIQTYDEIGVRQTEQIVHTRYGCRERDNIEYVDETWDVGFELDNYIRHLNSGFKPLANEYTVSDNVNYASQIDNVWIRESTNGIWLVDTKTNNIGLYPLCGYFNANYFTNGEDALKEYLSWQLSIYAVLFEAQNPGLKVEGVACNWLRKDTAGFWVINRKPTELVKELLTTEYIFMDNGPAYFHHDPSVFGIGQFPVKAEERVPIVAADVISYVDQLLRDYKVLESRLDEAKKGLRSAMEAHQVSKYDFGGFSATLSADGTATTFDSKRFKEENPELYKKYCITKPKKGSFILKSKEK